MNITSSGDNGTLQLPNSPSSGEHIGDYVSPYREKMSFFYFSDRELPIWVQLKYGNTEKLVPLWIQELKVNRYRDFLLPIVSGYLKDANLRPEYCRLDGQVRFFTVHPKDKGKHPYWILEDQFLSMPNYNTKFVQQSNGCLYFVNQLNLQDQVMAWDWRDGKRREISIPDGLSTITALADQNGLIVGCENGQIFGPECGLIRPKPSSISEIVAIGHTHFAVRYEDDSVRLIVSKNGVVAEGFNQICGIWSVGDRFLATLREKRVLLFFDVVGNEIVHEKDFSFELELEKITIISHTTLCVATNEEISIWEGGTSWTTLKKEDFFNIWESHEGVICEKNCRFCCSFYYQEDMKKSMRAENSWRDLVSSIKEKTFVFLPPDTYIFAQSPKRDVVCVTFFFRNQSERPLSFHVNGTWCVTSMNLLSDGLSLLYATDTRGSAIHVITTEGKQIFSRGEELTKERRILSFKEIEGGSVATLSSDNCIRVITPCLVPSENCIRRVTGLRSKLISDPNNINLYEELAGIFVPTDCSNIIDHHSAYHTYLDGLEAAARAGEFYPARRFYEKAKNIFSDRDEPMRLFLSYLKQFPNENIERNIQFDLYTLRKNKKCKQRLFIGEGDFSYTEALITKHIDTHKQLPSAIIATELEQPFGNMKIEVNQRTDSLKEMGVRICIGVDAQKIDEFPEFKNVKFERIHWNCPFGSNPRDRESFREVIPKFFCSCEKMQLIGDRVHVTLMQGYDDVEWHEKRQYENPIAKGSIESCYRLIRKRRFGKERYPGYNHKNAKGDEIRLPGVYREFVFEKVSPSMYNSEVTEDKIKNSVLVINDKKKYFIKNNKKIVSSSEIKPEECYFDCSTDDDSSDYWSD